MEIKNYVSSVYSLNSQQTNRSKAGKASNTLPAKNTDKVEFSSAANSGADSLKALISQSIKSDAGSERISALTSLVNDGQYCISAESIAKAILE